MREQAAIQSPARYTAEGLDPSEYRIHLHEKIERVICALQKVEQPPLEPLAEIMARRYQADEDVACSDEEWDDSDEDESSPPQSPTNSDSRAAWPPNDTTRLHGPLSQDRWTYTAPLDHRPPCVPALPQRRWTGTTVPPHYGRASTAPIPQSAMGLHWRGVRSDARGYVVRSDTLAGQGSFGSVYRGVWVNGRTTGSRRRVALKTLQLSNAPETLRKRFIREALAWSFLSHPNLLELFGTCECLLNGEVQLFFVSPFMELGNAVTHVATHPETDVALILFETAQALVYLHAATDLKPMIVHGDLKGENILIAANGSAVLGDFGLASMIDEEDVPSSILRAGTLSFKAPELVVDDPIPVKTAASDVYAFGMVVYQLFAGKPPFAGLDAIRLIFRLIQHQERPHRPGNCPGDIWDLAAQCWAQDAASRPRMPDVVERFREIFRQKRAGARPAREVSHRQDGHSALSPGTGQSLRLDPRVEVGSQRRLGRAEPAVLNRPRPRPILGVIDTDVELRNGPSRVTETVLAAASLSSVHGQATWPTKARHVENPLEEGELLPSSCFGSSTNELGDETLHDAQALQPELSGTRPALHFILQHTFRVPLFVYDLTQSSTHISADPLGLCGLAQAATQPARARLSIAAEFARVAWTVEVPGGSSVRGVLDAVHAGLQRRITAAEWAALGAAHQARVGAAFHARCRRWTDPASERASGVRRVDLFLGNTVFAGLMPMEEPGTYLLATAAAAV